MKVKSEKEIAKIVFVFLPMVMQPLLNFFFLVLVAKHCTLEEYGSLALSMVLVSVVIGFSDFGLRDYLLSKGAIDKILDFGSTVGGALGDAIKKDPLKAVQFLGGSLASWYAADEKKKAADLANRNLTQAQIDKENRLNASVTGQSAPKGIIQRELQRTDGSAVFNANRNINRG